MSQQLTQCLFSYLRLVTLIFCCLWLVVIAFDRFFLDSNGSVPSPVQFVQYFSPCVLGDNTSRCHQRASTEVNLTYSRDFTPYVELKPYHLSSIHLALFWTPYFSADALSKKSRSFLNALFGNDPSNRSPIFYRPKLCYQQYPQCLITTNRAYIAHAKTVIFHWRDLKTNDLPAERRPTQLWTLYNLEAPPNTRKLPENELALNFNLTASYRFDSNLVIPYGRVVGRHVNASSGISGVDLQAKVKQIAWFVSNCHTSGHREDFVQQLAHYIEVDIYGKCGTHSCQPPGSKECYEKVAHQYRFYLSFENSICKDYVTEKLFAIMEYNIVPIVFGGANYSQFMPPHSFIDATEMKPRDLARLLLKIGQDKKRYLKYLEWKRYFQMDVLATNYNEVLYCELCREMEVTTRAAQVHISDNGNLSRQHNRRSHFKTSAEINSWYFNDTCNQRRVKFF